VLLSVVAGLVLFAAGIAVGQRLNASKFDKYLRPASRTEMDLIALETNVESIRSLVPMEKGISIPKVTFNYNEAQPQATVVISPEFEKGPLAAIRDQITEKYYLAYFQLKYAIPELSEDDFLLKVVRVTKDPEHNLFAECRHGNIVFH
jgi:hypothetical protein